MLQIIDAMHKLNFGQLMNVYYESNTHSIRQACLDVSERLLQIEQDQYGFLCEFFKTHGAFIAVWIEEGTYKAALRVEPYSDGLLIEGVETAPDSRRRGYAKVLLQSVIAHLSGKEDLKVYSHVSKLNIPSIALHESCGFVKLHDYAAFIDGSVDHRTYTYIKKQGAD